jgi:hypothetical protein
MASNGASHEREEVFACALTGADARERAAWLRRLMRQASEIAGAERGVTVRFPYRRTLQAELRSIAVAEAECCPFLEIDVSREGEVLTLTIAGPADARPLIEQLCATSNDD